VIKYVLLHISIGVSVMAGSITLLCLPPAVPPALGRSAAAPQDRLEALRKHLPGAISRVLKKSGIDLRKEGDVKIALFRRLSANTAKMTLVLDGDSIITFYLSYYEGAWITTRHEERCAGWLNGYEKYVLDLALAIDEIGSTK